ncbi:phosphoribosylaminoimidazolecarboxamide formyltransferase [Nonomuraea sp. NPDC050680]|uniref:phosphoribosylaminoimidazolecarboxamide formyltransferase n=1 Tax=Nonomuraea sp. NPDC050680 TaxID=3154630 RepID=UPI003406B54A
MDLRYGMNPQQRSAVAVPLSPGRWPVKVLHGSPSYINMLDALNGWQLVSEASEALNRPAAASFKHVSPAGAAVAGPVDEVTAELNGVDRAAVGALTSAYLRARDADPKSSYGDFVAVSQPVDVELAELLTRLVCDGVIAPGYDPGTVAVLGKKKGGRFLVMEADPVYVPPRQEAREVFGVRLTQERDEVVLSTALLDDVVCGTLPATAAEDLLLGLIVLRYTQSNSVCYLRGGATLGIGAGQQSRVDCTRLAGAKVDTWWLRRHPMVRALAFRPDVRLQDRINWQIRFIEGDLTADEKLRLSGALSSPLGELTDEQRATWLATLDEVAFVSDGALPFRDNVDHASRHGVRYIAEPGGSIRSAEVHDACRERQIALARTGVRLFHH